MQRPEIADTPAGSNACKSKKLSKNNSRENTSKNFHAHALSSAAVPRNVITDFLWFGGLVFVSGLIQLRFVPRYTVPLFPAGPAVSLPAVSVFRCFAVSSPYACSLCKKPVIIIFRCFHPASHTRQDTLCLLSKRSILNKIIKRKPARITLP